MSCSMEAHTRLFSAFPLQLEECADAALFLTLRGVRLAGTAGALTHVMADACHW